MKTATHNRFHTGLAILWLGLLLLWLAHVAQWLYLNDRLVRFGVFYGACAGLPLWLVLRLRGVRFMGILVLLLSVLSLCLVVVFLRWNDDWKTQVILYQNKFDPKLTIEFQMRRDRFDFGYDKQLVRRKSILPFLDQISPADTAKLDAARWRPVHIFVNELQIPGESVEVPENHP